MDNIELCTLGEGARRRAPRNATESTVGVTDVTRSSQGNEAGLHRDDGPESSWEPAPLAHIVCTREKAIYFVITCICVLLSGAIIIAFARPVDVCPCIAKKLNDTTELDQSTVELLSTTGEVFPWNNLRLPTVAHPIRYTLSIHPNLTTAVVKGYVTIDLSVDENTKYIVFHSRGLTITEKIVQEAQKTHKIAKFLELPEREQIYLELEESFRKKTNYTLYLKFESSLSRNLEGFYLSSYVTPKNETRYVAATRFQPTFARAAFPCFDEPQFKARFKVSIYRDRFHIALFNMPVINSEEAGYFMGSGLLRDDFEESKEMSTYLVAFVICNFKRINSPIKEHIHVYAAEHLLPQALYAANTAAKLTEYFEAFFDVPYPLPKQDLIAIPNFTDGAMENWGLITFRDVTILQDPHETSIQAQASIATAIAHGLSHQWFGNLVTMKWWDDLWLSEGAASFFEYKGIDYLLPDWCVMDTFIIQKTQSALRLDALDNSHPISMPIKNPNEIKNTFDSISYDKGSAILYMLQEFLGEDIFQLGLKEYLSMHAYGNADADDLWTAIAKSMDNKYDIKAIMNTWTEQMGFPLVIIKRDGDTIKMVQKRFLMSPRNKTDTLRPASPFDYKWYIPVTYYTDEEPNIVYSLWLNMSNANLTEMSPDNVKYIKCNVNQTGFYRVNYTDDMWTAIIQALRDNHTKFSPADRANLIDDAFTLNEAGMLRATVPLKLSPYLVKEKDYLPWETVQTFLHSWRRRLSHHATFKKFNTFFKRLLKPVVKYVGWNDDGSHLKKLLRRSVLTSAFVLEMEDVLKPARTMFEDWLSNNTPIPANIRDIVYKTGIRYGDDKIWFRFWKIYRTTDVSNEKEEMLQALGVTQDRWLLQRYLLLSLDPEMIRVQDVGTVLKSVASVDNIGRMLVWRHIKANWPTIRELSENGSLPMNKLIADIVPNFYTKYDYEEILDFFEGNNIGSSKHTLEQNLELIKLNIQWLERNSEDLEDILTSDSEQ